MPMAWFSRCFFAAVAIVAVAGLLGGAACTRWGQPGPVVPTLAPLSQIYVDPRTGSDTSGNGTSVKPYKTLTKAIAVLASAKSFSTSGVTVNLAGGAYEAANGEQFPIVVPTNVTIVGNNFGAGPKGGTFIDGLGEDTLFEKLVRAPARTQYATFEIAAAASVSISNVYVGASSISLPSRAAYAALDVIGTLDASNSAFGAGIVSSLPYVSGVLVAGGSFTCSSCLIHGNDFGIGALTVPQATEMPSGTVPSITLSHSGSDSTITAKFADVLTDGSVAVTASGQHFERAHYAFDDGLHPVVYVPTRGPVDFGGGEAESSGGNTFIGARISEISVMRRYETISALDDTWNPDQQHANGGGLYPKKITFGAGTAGKNVTILKDAAGSTVIVGPAPVPTPTPTSPSSSPTPTPA